MLFFFILFFSIYSIVNDHRVIPFILLMSIFLWLQDFIFSIITWFEIITIFDSSSDFVVFSDLSFFSSSDLVDKSDNHVSFRHAPWDLPWPASEKMNSLVILYFEVSYTMLCVLLVVTFGLLETILTFGSYSNKKELYGYTKIDSENTSCYANRLPTAFSPEEEHFIDMFVIIIPTLIVIQVMLPTLGYLYNEEMLYYDTYFSFDVHVIGNQWYWTYEYAIDILSADHFSNWNNDYVCAYREQVFISFDSVLKVDFTNYRLLDVDHPLTLPINTNILFSFTSRDVIHSWALPQMGIKVDCIPGRITHTIFSSFSLGVFYGQCSELCGPLHAFMPICVEMIRFNDFFAWILLNYKAVLLDTYGIKTDFIYTEEVLRLLGDNLKKNEENNWKYI